MKRYGDRMTVADRGAGKEYNPDEWQKEEQEKG